ncbi:arylamine N-acetyltransferase family protein [Actinokineospora bangkokensis]|uniref:arylamine N-acetyltransferase family protein n=1 Tax=Actinokineospora bangkokensis TaxID=1193682 RepID=UPI001E48A44B|nr:arylamine N-acetyltransferase [Actinokineospora bangkokensis]
MSWDLDGLDLDAYLDRVGVAAREPSADALAELVRAHITAIPFDNVDVLLGTHPGVALPVVFDKLVTRRRGGYCFEHATLLAAALDRLGYPVRRRVGRIRPQGTGPRTHMVVLATADGVEHLADVGFGSGMWRPVPLRDGERSDQAGWPHLLTRDGATWTMAARGDDGWEPAYSWDDAGDRPVDAEMGHHFTSTHPSSPFVGSLVVVRLAEGSLRRLVGTTLRVEDPSGATEQREITREDMPATLRDLGVELPDDVLDALLARLY